MVPSEVSNDQLVRDHEAWVRGIAKSAARELGLSHAIDDLLGYAYQGLLDAHARYEPSGGVPFQGFAYSRVRGAVLDGAYRVRGMTRRALVSAMQAIETRKEEVAERRVAVAPEHRVEDALGQIDELLHTFVDANALAMLAEDEASGEARMIAALDRERVRRAVSKLPERERDVLEGVYFEDAPLDDIGAKLGLSRSGTSRLHTRALGMLREALR